MVRFALTVSLIPVLMLAQGIGLLHSGIGPCLHGSHGRHHEAHIHLPFAAKKKCRCSHHQNTSPRKSTDLRCGQFTHDDHDGLPVPDTVLSRALRGESLRWSDVAPFGVTLHVVIAIQVRLTFDVAAFRFSNGPPIHIESCRWQI